MISEQTSIRTRLQSIHPSHLWKFQPDHYKPLEAEGPLPEDFCPCYLSYYLRRTPQGWSLPLASDNHRYLLPNIHMYTTLQEVDPSHSTQLLPKLKTAGYQLDRDRERTPRM